MGKSRAEMHNLFLVLAIEVYTCEGFNVHIPITVHRHDFMSFNG